MDIVSSRVLLDERIISERVIFVRLILAIYVTIEEYARPGVLPLYHVSYAAWRLFVDIVEV